MGKKKNLSLGRLTLRVMIPALVLLTGIILVMFRSIFDARSLVYKYIEDTAGRGEDQYGYRADQL